MAEVEYKNLTSKVKVPAIGLGTWKMGGNFVADRSQDGKYIEAIQYAISRGITHIDTAEIYGAGHAEELVGKAIKKFDRKKLFITTKVSPHHLFTKGQIESACKNSLKRLQTDYIDLCLIHWPNPLASIKNVMAVFGQLVDEGKVKNIGVSNFSARQLKNAQKYSKANIVCNQVHYSLLTRGPQKELLNFAQKEKIILCAYSPLEQGEVIDQLGDKLRKIAKKYSKTPVQAALRWLLDQEQVITIPKASSKEHIDEILGSLGWSLKKEDWEYLESYS